MLIKSISDEQLLELLDEVPRDAKYFVNKVIEAGFTWRVRAQSRSRNRRSDDKMRGLTLSMGNRLSSMSGVSFITPPRNRGRKYFRSK